MRDTFSTTKEIILQQVASGALPSYIAKMPLTPETRLLDLGIDSLGKMTLIVELAEHFRHDFSAMEVDENTTLGQIASYIQAL